jgi:hypothetical protein
VFVGFAPDAGPRLYENYANWDFGFLFLLGDRLCYVGEQTRFALRRDQVTGWHLGRGLPRWWQVPSLYVSWEDAERGTFGTFNVRAGQVRSMRQLRRATADLEAMLRRWWEQPAAPAEVPPALGGLPTPSIGEVTSVPVLALLNPSGLVFQSGFVFLLGLGVSLLLGLPFAREQGRLAWYVPAVAVLGLWFQLLPLWWDRLAETGGAGSGALGEVPGSSGTHRVARVVQWGCGNPQEDRGGPTPSEGE